MICMPLPLAGDVDVSWWSWILSSLIIWLVNGAIVTVVMARLFVFGEPVTKPLSDSSVMYWRSRKQADLDLARVSQTPVLKTLKY